MPTLTPTASTPPSLDGRVIGVLPTQAGLVALTFDAGAGDAGVASILHTLNAQGVRATFFLTGDFVSSHPAASEAIAEQGHVIGNHTVSHPHMRTLSEAELRAEVTTAERTISDRLGVSAKPWFRFPYGEYDARTLRVVNVLGYVAIGWTVDTVGWRGRADGGSAAAVISRVMAALRPGAIVLMHVGSNPGDHSTLDADALPGLIERLRAAGYHFTTIRTLLP